MMIIIAATMKEWTPQDWSTFMIALAGLITAIFAAYKSVRAETQSTSNSQAIGRTNDRIVNVAQSQDPTLGNKMQEDVNKERND